MILLVTRSDDHPGVEDVAAALRALGERPVRLDTDRYPTELRLSLHQSGEGERFVLDTPEGPVDLCDATAVWYRRMHPGAGLSRDLDPQLSAASVGEARAVLLGMLHALPCFQLDPWAAVRRAEQKPMQLALARRCGLEIPRTLSTNDPEAAREFVASCVHGAVAKMLSSFAVHEDGEERVVFTNPITAADLDDLDGLALSPMTFQERAVSAREHRVTMVGDRVFASSLEAGLSERSHTDWRRDGDALAREWKPSVLPAEVTRGLLALMDRLGLNYGAADVIETPDGRYVFLECNPAGEFYWVARDGAHSITDAIAEVLAGKVFRRSAVAPGSGFDHGQ